MKIVFVIDSLKRGGKERRLIELLHNLPKDIEFKIILLKNEIEFDIEKILKNIKIYDGQNSKLKKIIWFSKVINAYKPDIVHSWYHECSQFSLPICKIKKIKFITSEITNITPPYKKILSLSRLIHFIIFKYSNIITSNSNAGLKAYNTPINKSFVIHNGFNFKRTKTIKISSKEKENSGQIVVLMIANFTDKKDYNTFLRGAINLLQNNSNIVFIGIGKGENLEMMRNSIPEKLTANIRFPGYVENVEEEIVKSDIGVLTSFGEGFPNTVMEFMALKKPVIASTGGGTNELIDNGKTGLIIPQKSPDVLKKAIEFFLDNPEEKINYGTRGYERLCNNFSIDIMTKKFINLYFKD